MEMNIRKAYRLFKSTREFDNRGLSLTLYTIGLYHNATDRTERQKWLDALIKMYTQPPTYEKHVISIYSALRYMLKASKDGLFHLDNDNHDLDETEDYNTAMRYLEEMKIALIRYRLLWYLVFWLRL